jgi:hypothetical protein
MAMSVSAFPGPDNPAHRDRADRADREREMKEMKDLLAKNAGQESLSLPPTAVYPTTSSGGWTVVHHGILGHAHTLEPFHPPASGRRAHSSGHTTQRLPISSAAPGPWRPPPLDAPAARPLPVPPPLDTVSVGSTTFTRPPPAEPSSSSSAAGKGKRRASVTAGLVLDVASPASPASARPLPPLPPPSAGPPQSQSYAAPAPSSSSASSSAAGPSTSRQQQKPTASSAHPKSRSRTPDRRVPYGCVFFFLCAF